MAQFSSLPIAPIALLLFGLVGILLLTIPSQDVQDAPGFLYGIVLDAGSSHTSLYIYKWPADKQNGTGVVTQHSECSVDGGGISSYAGQVGAAGRSLRACLNRAVEEIPKEKHPNTPVYLGATAGMRLLNKSSPQQSDQVLAEVGSEIQSFPFSYRGAVILSGREEGAYGWVTVNYLQENFIKFGFVGRWFSSGRATVGALDFGGASTQITFVTQQKVEDEANRKELRLYGHVYSLYTHSFLCYGQDQLLKKLLAQIVKSQGYAPEVNHPCYPANFTRTLKMENIFDSPCTVQYKPDTYNPQRSLTLRGSGHYQNCFHNVSELFLYDGCPFSRCSFDKVFQPKVTGNFMAFSAFYFIHSSLQKVTGVKVSTPLQLENATKTVCSMNYSQLQMMSEAENPDRLKDFCASSVFIKALLLRGYGFDDASFPGISFQNTAGDASVGWAMGYMLVLSNLLPAESAGVRKSLTVGAWGMLLFLFIVLLIICVCLLFRARSKRKKGGDESAI
ncbi:ectonucleoside triphosphate diphosphohydrolase 2-like [Xiphophorus couchianus]|uniref:ectonucleoside triphosphate diphosphohydrolase 2-like n=1 Tax=Xiphophorus couchianus TaxID=32473 RepID=UPI001015F0F1|nr:ectonucleoside triphosphate diphosphohydrolase 2-like [Xiphophorus couchianus]